MQRKQVFMDTCRKIWVYSCQTPCGGLKLGTFEGKLCLCNWIDEKHPGRVERRLQTALKAAYAEGETELIREAVSQLDDYFVGRRTVFDLPLLIIGTDFQRRVWRRLQEIPYGQTLSYASLAASLGVPRAVRAVANANGANALSLFIPCHRVVGAGGALTGYAGGLEAKRFLLHLESQRCLTEKKA